LFGPTIVIGCDSCACILFDDEDRLLEKLSLLGLP
jgi:hypothetical protein